MQQGDVIIMATDGLFDNVELDEICRSAFFPPLIYPPILP